MRVLLLHDITPDTDAAAALLRAGHQVVRCSSTGTRFPCDAAAGACPLADPVDVAVVVHDRPAADLAPGEAGAVCAIRDGLPLVLSGNGARHAFGARVDAVAAGMGDLVPACNRAIARRQRWLATRIAEEVGCAPGALAVSQAGGAVRVRVTDTDGVGERLAVAVHGATRRAVPGAQRIDVERVVPPDAAPVES